MILKVLLMNGWYILLGAVYTCILMFLIGGLANATHGLTRGGVFVLGAVFMAFFTLFFISRYSKFMSRDTLFGEYNGRGMIGCIGIMILDLCYGESIFGVFNYYSFGAFMVILFAGLSSELVYELKKTDKSEQEDLEKWQKERNDNREN